MNETNRKDEVLHYGVNRYFEKSNHLDKYSEEIYYNGYTIIPEVIDSGNVSEISTAIDLAYAAQIDELGGLGLAEKINDADIVRCPLAYNDVFVELSLNAVVISILKSILGQSILLIMQNAIINRPSAVNYQSRWHRDLNYQHWTSSKPLALNALFVIDPFTVESGCTHVLPGTHLRSEFPSEEFVLKHESPAVAEPGSVIIMDSMIYHRSGKNSSNYARRAVNHVIGLPFMSQQIDIPKYVGPRLATDDFARGFFGYRWNPATSAKDWRNAKSLQNG